MMNLNQMIRRATVLGSLAMLAGCGTLTFGDTVPEVTIKNVSREKVHHAIMEDMLNAGHRMSYEDSHTLVFYRASSNSLLTALLTDDFDPNVLVGGTERNKDIPQVTYILSETPEGIRVVAELSYVVNPGTPFERQVGGNAKPFSDQYEGFLTDLKLDLES